MGISKSMYETLSNTSVLWICTNCDTPNHSTILYESTMSVSNSFAHLSAITEDTISHNSSISSFGNPPFTSSPKARNNYEHFKHPDKLRVIIINFQNIKNKAPDLQMVIDSTKPDVIIGTESWLSSDVNAAEVFPPDFEVFRCDRKDDPHGGVLIATRQTMVSSIARVGNDCEFISVKVKLNRGKSALISAAYRPPNRTDEAYTQALISDITATRTEHKSAYFLLGGNFNLPDIDWKAGAVNGHSLSRQVNDAYINMYGDLALDQVVSFPTRGSNILDLFFTSHPSIIDKCKALPALGKSDHDIVMIDLTLDAYHQHVSRRKILLWDKADQAVIRQHIDNAMCKILDNSYATVNDIWSELKSSITSIVEENIPSKMSRSRYSNPWMTTKVKRLLRRRQKAFRVARRSNNVKNQARYRHLKATAQREMRKAHDDFIDQTVCGELQGNSKRFWSYLKIKRQDSQGVAPLRKTDGLLYNYVASNSDILNQQFHSVYQGGHHKHARQRSESISRHASDSGCHCRSLQAFEGHQLTQSHRPRCDSC